MTVSENGIDIELPEVWEERKEEESIKDTEEKERRQPRRIRLILLGGHWNYHPQRALLCRWGGYLGILRR
jgi:hypothetical protein